MNPETYDKFGHLIERDQAVEDFYTILKEIQRQPGYAFKAAGEKKAKAEKQEVDTSHDGEFWKERFYSLKEDTRREILLALDKIDSIKASLPSAVEAEQWAYEDGFKAAKEAIVVSLSRILDRK